MTQTPLTRKAFTAELRKIGGAAYHDQHPFHALMNSGQLDREAIQIWVAHRFYYQSRIPMKDAAIMSNCPEREIRRVWIHRIVDHDGEKGDEGGIGAWLRLGEACGVRREKMLSGKTVLPGVKYAVDAYVNFAKSEPWPIAVASSLTELFAPGLMAKRLAAFEKYYPWVEARGLEYFRNRLVQAPRDSGEALEITLDRCRSRDMQEAALAALRFKCELLWAILDCTHAHVLKLGK